MTDRPVDEPDRDDGAAQPDAGADPATPRGVEAIRAALRTMPSSPGVYRMIDGKGDVLYVGKARNLKRRVINYTQPHRLPVRIQRMIAATLTMEVLTTHTEAEALLLESNLIKKLKPRYNILLRDDKSFPYIEITSDHAFPRIVKFRGTLRKGGEYFGPFASAGAVTSTLTALQKTFLLRTCADNVFASRSRPCLLFQIKRCAAPCVDRVAEADYKALVEEARAFLSGSSKALQHDLAKRMDEAAQALDYEQAAIFRDRIKALTNVQSHQDINLPTLGEADVIACHQAGGQTCVQVFFFRGGRNNGNRSFFPAHAGDEGLPEVLEAFLGQFYAGFPPPREILLLTDIPHHDLVEQALCLRAGHRVRLVVPRRGSRRKLIDHALLNAREALGRRLAESSAQRTLLEGTAVAFGLDGPLQRVEIYDNSHISGTHAVGGMVVAGPEGFMKAAYRKFNIRSPDITPGDDYAMMREVMIRRFARARKEDPDRDRGQWPDLVLIDGGLGQLNAVREALAEIGVEDVPLVGVAKGPDRDAGRERFFVPNRPPFMLRHNDPVLYFIQRLRDEAHRFAIGSHRTRRSKAIGVSPLDSVPGIGASRKKALLHHFGSAKAVSQAGLTDLEAVEGISAALAKKLYDHFHGEG
ncbi:excinuclease ABC subunit C [Rhodospirillum rubrum]|uniref:excinuclease ABC subunit UvrC n=1 Tax=Rhodospirillum rubrum TaxID=1085 RepID=UPI0019077E2F|nr:excinuclease ABC subunit UvrC [Rhodospirillum rubrum]MBK1666295.1 excinuclease ABC subunit C [Rhodospirillum rubrum]MBK1678511.1 excinuclease ABC subunit C [Rhodospirillum rubrum]